MSIERCGAYRAPSGKVKCERVLDHDPHDEVGHAGRDAAGHWHFWDQP